MKQHYFDVPFAFAGDVTAIPDPLQVGGTVSMTEGWNNNYQRNLSTDPSALPIDRSTTNWLLLQISTALQALQQAGVPEFILASQNGGAAFSYGKGSPVLWSASGNAPFAKYVSLTAGNTNTPSAGDPQGLTTGWQLAVDPISTAAQASAGTDDASIMTPLKVAQQTALRALLAGNSSQVFNVGPATASTHSVQASQMGSYYSQTTVTANQVLTTALLGQLLIVGGSNTTFMPAASSMSNGQGWEFVNTSSSTASTLQVNASPGTDVFSIGTISASTLTIPPGQAVKVWRTGGGTFRVSGLATANVVPVPVAAATAATHAPQFSQLPGIVGQSRGVSAIQTAAANTLAVTGVEVNVETSAGLRFTISALNATFNGTGTGANGMDTGAIPTNGFLAIYAIYNPTTQTSAVLGVNASSTLTEVYSGANMPSGYTASALLFVVPTTAGALVGVCVVRGRRTGIPSAQVFSVGTPQASPTISNNLAVPLNAKRFAGYLQISNTAASSVNLSIYATATSVQPKVLASTLNASSVATPFDDVEITTAQRTFYTMTSSGGSPTGVCNVSSWEI